MKTHGIITTTGFIIGLGIAVITLLLLVQGYEFSVTFKMWQPMISFLFMFGSVLYYLVASVSELSTQKENNIK